jgi:hypothetical protein
MRTSKTSAHTKIYAEFDSEFIEDSDDSDEAEEPPESPAVEAAQQAESQPVEENVSE